jgi:hypothetical protein
MVAGENGFVNLRKVSGKYTGKYYSDTKWIIEILGDSYFIPDQLPELVEGLSKFGLGLVYVEIEC